MIPILVAYNREALQDMMSTLKKFLEGRKLELYTKKTEIIVSGERGRKRKEKLKWGRTRGGAGIQIFRF